MMMAGIETFTAVMAILSVGLRSRIELRWGARVLRYIGIEVIAATPLTSALPRVRSHSVRKAGGPAATMSAEPDSSRSLTRAGPPSLIHSTLQIGDAAVARVALDQALLLHDQERQEADAAGTARDLDRVGLGMRQRRPQQRRSAKARQGFVAACPYVSSRRGADRLMPVRGPRL